MVFPWTNKNVINAVEQKMRQDPNQDASQYAFPSQKKQQPQGQKAPKSNGFEGMGIADVTNPYDAQKWASANIQNFSNENADWQSGYAGALENKIKDVNVAQANRDAYVNNLNNQFKASMREKGIDASQWKDFDDYLPAAYKEAGFEDYWNENYGEGKYDASHNLQYDDLVNATYYLTQNAKPKTSDISGDVYDTEGNLNWDFLLNNNDNFEAMAKAGNEYAKAVEARDTLANDPSSYKKDNAGNWSIPGTTVTALDPNTMQPYTQTQNVGSGNKSSTKSSAGTYTPNISLEDAINNYREAHPEEWERDYKSFYDMYYNSDSDELDSYRFLNGVATNEDLLKAFLRSPELLPLYKNAYYLDADGNIVRPDTELGFEGDEEFWNGWRGFAHDNSLITAYAMQDIPILAALSGGTNSDYYLDMVRDVAGIDLTNPEYYDGAGGLIGIDNMYYPGDEWTESVAPNWTSIFGSPYEFENGTVEDPMNAASVYDPRYVTAIALMNDLNLRDYGDNVYAADSFDEEYGAPTSYKNITPERYLENARIYGYGAE